MEKASHRKVTDADGLGGADLKITNHLSRGKTVLETHEGIARIAYLCASLRQKSSVEMAIVVSSSLLSELNYASSTISPNGTSFECACKVLARVLGMLEEVDGIVFYDAKHTNRCILDMLLYRICSLNTSAETCTVTSL